jgi:integrase
VRAGGPKYAKFAPLAEMRLSDFSGETVTRYVKWRKENPKPPSVSRINGELRTLRRIFKLAYEWGLIDRPSIVHELPGEKGRERVITFEEEARYLNVSTPTLYDAAILGADTGMRPNSELFCLEWTNVFLEPGLNTPNGFLHVVRGKTENAVRNIPLTTRAHGVLLARLAKYGSNRFVFPGAGKTSHLVTVQHVHEKTVERAKLDPFQFYCWRHTFGTRCAESGMDKFSLARLMGHSSPRVAERYYVHVTEPHVMTGFERFEAYQEKNITNLVTPVVTPTIRH